MFGRELFGVERERIRNNYVIWEDNCSVMREREVILCSEENCSELRERERNNNYGKTIVRL